MRTDAMEKRIRKLEVGRLPTPRYVVALSPEEFELPDLKRRKLISLRSGGRPVAVMPIKCASSEEWAARYADQADRG